MGKKSTETHHQVNTITIINWSFKWDKIWISQKEQQGITNKYLHFHRMTWHCSWIWALVPFYFRFLVPQPVRSCSSCKPFALFCNCLGEQEMRASMAWPGRLHPIGRRRQWVPLHQNLHWPSRFSWLLTFYQRKWLLLRLHCMPTSLQLSKSE